MIALTAILRQLQSRQRLARTSVRICVSTMQVSDIAQATTAISTGLHLEQVVRLLVTAAQLPHV